ncbi:MAG: glycosyltransferase [Sideroxydans sp.]|nr:glycosyltransferase [Sideroxydans sp.]
MKIGLQSWGSTGDINPFLALAAALAAAGHSVTLAITSTERRDYALEGERFGFAVRQVGHVGIDVSALNEVGMRMLKVRNPLQQLGVVFDNMFDPNVQEMHAAARLLAAGNDLLIGHFFVHPLQLAAEQAGKPYFTVSLNHGTIATREVPPHPLPDLGHVFNGVLWRLGGWMMSRVALPSANRLRMAVGAPLLTSIKPVWQSPIANLIAVSRELAPQRADWGANQMVCGFLALPHPVEPLSPQLTAFLQAGSPPIYFTFGSMMGLPEPHRELEQLLAIWLETVRLAGCRAIIQTHWAMTDTATDDNQIFRIESADHRAIFPHCAAVVHHGGAGTTQSASASGRPSIIVAHIADQFFWGGLLHNLGIAPKMIHRHKLTAAKLARTIRQVLGDNAMRQRAREIGARMNAEDGARRAVVLIEEAYSRIGSNN